MGLRLPRADAAARELAALGRALLALVLPDACAGCRTPRAPDAQDGPLCPPCRAALPPLLADGTPAPRILASVRAAAPLEGGWERWIHRFKYPAPGLRGLDPGAEAVAAWLVREALRRAAGPPPDLVVPVPLHPRRLRRRGFHPPAALAREVARAVGRPVAPTLLRRIRDTPSQTDLSRTERRRNVAGAFAVHPPGPAPRRVWLVDDVVTTGATLAEAARALRRAGAREIHGVCCARTPAPPG